MLDVMAALRTAVLSDSAIDTLVSTSFVDVSGNTVSSPVDRVYVTQIPESIVNQYSTKHPAKTLVLREAGGFGKSDLLPIVDSTITAIAYGEIYDEAATLLRAVYEYFVYLQRQTFSGVLIHTINPTGGPIPSVEPDLLWPAIAQSFTVKADVMEAA